ncbi:MAG: hypothetical protein ACKO2K_17045 [Alphaproteobacteria bacterium]
MSSHLAILASLGLALFLSPETLVLGFVIASDRKAPRLAAWTFALGGLVGLAFALTVGMLISPTPSPSTAPVPVSELSHRWWRFGLHALIAAALIVIGTRRALAAFEQSPITDDSVEPSRKSRLWNRFATRFPSAAHVLDPSSDLAPRGIAERAALAGFAICGLHPKIFPVAIAAGHQVEEMPSQLRPLGLVVFVSLALGATLVPAILETIRPGSAGSAKAAIERFMEVYGRPGIALLLVGVGLDMARRAVELFPG